MTCEKCYQPIRLQKVTYKGKDYHGGCFSCEVCKRSFKNNTTDIKETKGGFYDLVCYENNKEMICAKCEKLMLDGGLEYKGQGYHDDCFVCFKCKKSLSGKAFHVEDDEFYDAQCFNEMNSMECDQCHEMIAGDNIKYITYHGKCIHYECFKCSECRKQLSTAEKFRDVKTTVKGALICLPCSDIKQAHQESIRKRSLPKHSLPVAGMYKQFNFVN